MRGIRLSVFNVKFYDQKTSKDGFDLIKDQKMLKYLLTSNDLRPISIECDAFSSSVEELPHLKLDKDRRALIIPFYFKTGRYLVPTDMSFLSRYVKVDYYRYGDFSEELFRLLND